MRRALQATALAVLLLAGCAGQAVDVHFWDPDAVVLPLLNQPAAPERRLLEQYVVLLPDDDGSVGAIEVSNGEATVTLTEPYQAVDFDNLAAPYKMEPAEAGFAPEVAHLPPPPVRFTVYFDYASPHWTRASEQTLTAMVAEITGRSAPEITLHGHADRAGTEADNERFSKQRAEAIRDQILAAGVARDSIHIEWHGEAMPAVPTADGVREGRNRRVEILVR